MAIIRLKIDVTKLDKTAFFDGKNGAKYADITLLENKGGPDRYGNDFMCVQDLGKKRREAGEKGAILGNAKYAGQPQQQRSRDDEPHEERKAERPLNARGQELDSQEVPF